MKNFSKADIQKMEQLFRARMINSIGGFKSVNLVGTVDGKGNTNLSIVSSVFHLGANPALMGFIMRPIIVTRDTFLNIKETGYYTFNSITSEIYKQAHQTSARYPSEVSEFDAVNLNAVFKKDFPAPFVTESPVQIGLAFKEQIDIKLNGTVMMIGEIQEVFIPENCLLDDGFIDIEKTGSITCSGLDAYYSTQKIARLSYAKPDLDIVEL